MIVGAKRTPIGRRSPEQQEPAYAAGIAGRTGRADDLSPVGQSFDFSHGPASHNMPTPPGPQHAAPNFSIPMQAPQFFVENAAAGTFIARQAVLSDPDSPNFGGGWMTVSKAGATATDHLEIKDGDGIVRSGATLRRRKRLYVSATR